MTSTPNSKFGPMKELELSCSSRSRGVLQPLENSFSKHSTYSSSSYKFDWLDDLEKSRYSIQSWPQDRFTQPNFFQKFQEPDTMASPSIQRLLNENGQEIFKTEDDGFQDPEMASPSIQRLLNDQEQQEIFKTQNTIPHFNRFSI